MAVHAQPEQDEANGAPVANGVLYETDAAQEATSWVAVDSTALSVAFGLVVEDRRKVRDEMLALRRMLRFRDEQLQSLTRTLQDIRERVTAALRSREGGELRAMDRAALLSAYVVLAMRVSNAVGMEAFTPVGLQTLADVAPTRRRKTKKTATPAKPRRRV